MTAITATLPIGLIFEKQDNFPKKLTIDEFMQIAQNSDKRMELIDGQIVAMTGGTSNHSLIAVNVLDIRHFLRKNKPNCKIYNSDFGVQTKANQIRYPDFCIACGVDGNATYTANPILVGEVLSKGNSKKEMDNKVNEYKNVHSVQEIVLISQEKKCVTLYRRGAFFGWGVDEITQGAVTFACIDCTVDIDEFYVDTDV